MKPLRLMIYDDKPGDGGLQQKFLRLSWIVGGMLFKLFGKIDECKGVTSWPEALEWLSSHDEIQSVQFWGHGSPGAVWIGREPLVAWKLSGVLSEPLKKLASKMVPSSNFWIRSCSVFRGRIGRMFALDLHKALLGRKVAGHVRIVGPIQPALRTLSLGGSPDSWPADPVKESWMTWDDRSVLCLAATLPKDY